MSEIISHQGIVKHIDENHIEVKIIQTSACASCSAKGLCSAADSKEKVIDIYTRDDAYRVGEEVTVTAETTMGMLAVFWAFVIPFFILIISLAIFIHVSGSELLAALAALAALTVYYVVLGFNRDRLKKRFSFKIQHNK